MSTAARFGLLAIKALLTAAFVAAGGAKIASVPDMVAVFEAIGFGQWFRYATGVIEIAGAVLLWTPGKQLWGAAALLATMVGAVIAHLAILGPSAVPALVLGALVAIVAYAHRDQIA